MYVMYVAWTSQKLQCVLYMVIHSISRCVFVLSIQVFRAKELLDNTLALIKNAMSGAIVDPDRLVIGTEEGLFCLDLDHSGKFLGTLSLQQFICSVIPNFMVKRMAFLLCIRKASCSVRWIQVITGAMRMTPIAAVGESFWDSFLFLC